MTPARITLSRAKGWRKPDSVITIRRDDQALVTLVEAVTNIARQKTSAEATEGEFISGDYEYGYDTCVSVARVALAAFTARMEGT